MTELLFDWSFLILIILLSVIVWKKIKANSNTSALVFILLIGLLLRSFVSSDIRLHDWDEQYHALVAKNLTTHPLKPTLYENPVISYETQNWVGNHIWLEKPPVALWCMSAFTYFFGANTWAIRLPSLIFGLLSVLLTYKIGSILFEKRVGLLAAYLHTINGVIIELGAGRISSDHVETTFLFFVELAIFLSLYFSFKSPKYHISLLIGLVFGLAFLSKWYPAAIVLPIWTFCVILFGKISVADFFKHGFFLVTAAAIVIFPWVYYIKIEFPVESTFVLDKFLNAYSSSVENHVAPWYYYLHKIMVLFGELIYLVIAFSIYFISKRSHQYQILMLLTWIILPVIIFSFGETKRFTYLLIAAPAFFVLTSQIWFFLYDTIPQYKRKWLICSILIALMVLPMRLTVERIKPFESKITSEEPFYHNLAEYKGILGPKDVVFDSDQNIKLMFFTNVGAAYRKSPTLAEISELKRKGYRIYSMQNFELIEL